MPYMGGGVLVSRERRLVLLVDDCADSREMYAEYLSDEFAIVHAASGAEAIDRAVALRPDVVVMDLGLPGISGVEASHRLKRDPRTHAIPLLIVSGQAEQDVTVSSAKPVWNGFLAKPCSPALLAAFIRRAIHERA